VSAADIWAVQALSELCSGVGGLLGGVGLLLFVLRLPGLIAAERSR